MSKKGILLVLMQPPPAFEEEFHAWYDTEHVPERLAVPGFESGLRFVCVSGSPRYLALYDLARPEVLDSAEYARVSGENNSPWTTRVTSRVRVYRSAGTQIYPGTALAGKAARLMLLRFRSIRDSDDGAIVASMRQLFENKPTTNQVRVFSCPVGGGVDVYGLVEASGLIEEKFDTDAFGPLAGALDLLNVYANY
jgi:hypothetical protein